MRREQRLCCFGVEGGVLPQHGRKQLGLFIWTVVRSYRSSSLTQVRTESATRSNASFIKTKRRRGTVGSSQSGNRYLFCYPRSLRRVYGKAIAGPLCKTGLWMWRNIVPRTTRVLLWVWTGCCLTLTRSTRPFTLTVVQSSWTSSLMQVHAKVRNTVAYKSELH
jgi:hypothetical protein